MLAGLEPRTVRVLAATDDGPVALLEFALGDDELRATALRLLRAGLIRPACFDPRGAELIRATLTGGLSTMDFAPVLGAADVVGGLVWATGHHRNGILLAPVTAELVAGILDGGDAPPAFAPGRFARPREGAAA